MSSNGENGKAKTKTKGSSSSSSSSQQQQQGRGSLASMNGKLEEIVGVSPFGIYCKSCKNKIASSTFRNHIRDVHPDYHHPKTVNYTAVSRDLERLVETTKRTCGINLEDYLIPEETCERYQCTSCQCLFDSKGNAKRHFLSMKSGCVESSSLNIVKCRKTICYRAVTFTQLERMVEEAKNRPPEKQQEEENAKEEELPPAEEKDALPTTPKKRKSSSSRKRSPSSSASKKKTGGGGSNSSSSKKKKAKRRTTAADLEMDDDPIEPKVYKPPPGARSSARLRSKQT